MPVNVPQLWFRVSAVKNIYVFKTHTSFLLWWPRLPAKLQRVSGDAGGSSIIKLSHGSRYRQI